MVKKVDGLVHLCAKAPSCWKCKNLPKTRCMAGRSCYKTSAWQ